MKTESEYQQLFIDNCSNGNHGTREIAARYWIDMTSNLTTYFSHESRSFITVKAAQLLKTKLETGMPTEQAWQEVIRDFLTDNYWDQTSQIHRPAIKKTEEQKNFSTLVKYGSILLLTSIVLKVAVTFFGVQSTASLSLVNPVWVWVVFGILMITLFVFAYRSDKNDN